MFELAPVPHRVLDADARVERRSSGKPSLRAARTDGPPSRRFRASARLLQDAVVGKEYVRTVGAFLTNDSAVFEPVPAGIIGADVQYRPDAEDGSGPRGYDDGLLARSVAQPSPRPGTQRSARCRYRAPWWVSAPSADPSMGRAYGGIGPPAEQAEMPIGARPVRFLECSSATWFGARQRRGDRSQTHHKERGNQLVVFGSKQFGGLLHTVRRGCDGARGCSGGWRQNAMVCVAGGDRGDSPIRPRRVGDTRCGA